MHSNTTSIIIVMIAALLVSSPAAVTASSSTARATCAATASPITPAELDGYRGGWNPIKAIGVGAQKTGAFVKQNANRFVGAGYIVAGATVAAGAATIGFFGLIFGADPASMSGVLVMGAIGAGLVGVGTYKLISGK